MKVINRKWVLEIVRIGSGIPCDRCGKYVIQGEYAYRSLDKAKDGFYDCLCTSCGEHYDMIQIEPPQPEEPPRGIVCYWIPQ